MKQFKQAAEIFISLCMISCFVAFALAVGMLLLPVAMLIVLALAIREIIIWKKKEAGRKPSVMVVHERKTKQRPYISVTSVFSSVKESFRNNSNHRRMTFDF